MSVRRLLNVAYAALAQGRDDDGLKLLDSELEADPSDDRRRRPKKTQGNFAALLAAARMPQRAGS